MFGHKEDNWIPDPVLDKTDFRCVPCIGQRLFILTPYVEVKAKKSQNFALISHVNRVSRIAKYGTGVEKQYPMQQHVAV